MNTNLTFGFVTRPISDDYRVFGNDGENVEFMQEDFTAWLQGKKRRNINFSGCIEGDVISREGDKWPDVWVPKGTMLRWRTTEDDEISCERLSVEERRPARQTPIKSRKIPTKPKIPRQIPKWLVPVLCFAAGAVIGAGIYGLLSRENVAPLFEVYADDDIQVSEGVGTQTVKNGEILRFNFPGKITISIPPQTQNL